MNKKIHAAGIFVIRKDYKVLICHPTNHSTDVWSIPKGKIEDGEDAMDAAMRETYEETNIDFHHDDRLSVNKNFDIFEMDVVDYSHKRKDLKSFVFKEVKHSDIKWSEVEIKCNSNVPDERGGFAEMDLYKWVTLENAKKLLHYTQSECINKFENLIK